VKVLLIWPCNEMAKEVPEMFPLGLGYLANSLPDHEVEILDCVLDDLQPNSVELVRRLTDFNPDVVGISAWSNNLNSVKATTEAVREALPSCKIIWGGPDCLRYDDASQTPADIVIHGEGECALPHVLGGDWRDVSGLDDLGFVDYEQLRLRDYHEKGYHYAGYMLPHPEKKPALIMSTRGCPYSCQFCAGHVMSGHKIRHHSVDYIIRTIENLYHNFDVRVIALGDDNFLVNKEFASSLMAAIANLNHDDLIMVAPNGVRISSVTADMIPLMQRAGFEEIMVSPESGSPRMLGLMGKDDELSMTQPMLDACHKQGMFVRANFIVGFPGENGESIYETAVYIRRHDFDHVAFHYFTPLPGSPIFNELVAAGEITTDFNPERYDKLAYCAKGLKPEFLETVFISLNRDFNVQRGLREFWESCREVGQ